MTRLLPLLLLPLLACGDDAVAPAAPLDSGVDEAATPSTLSADQRQAFCQAAATWFTTQVTQAQMKKLACYGFALAFAGQGNACNTFASECLASNEPFDSSTDASCDGPELDDCTATVAELETCFTDTATQLRTLTARLSCSMSASDLQGLSGKPASCAAIESKCPGLFADDAPAE